MLLREALMTQEPSLGLLRSAANEISGLDAVVAQLTRERDAAIEEANSCRVTPISSPTTQPTGIQP